MIRECRLDNGLALLSESMPDLRSVSLGVWLRQGSRHEPAAINGISHFIEHLVFKGTERRSSLEIAREIDAVGGQMDAFTAKESTCFYIRVLDRHVDLALDLLTDIVRHPRFDPEDIEKERKVIAEEIHMVEDTPEDLVYDMLYSSRWAGHPLGRPIQGSLETVADMDPATLREFFRGAYVPNQMVLSVAGKLDLEAIVGTVQEAFVSMPRAAAPAVGEPPLDRGGLVIREKSELEQIHLAVALGGLPQVHPDRYVLMVMSNILGGTMSSRLFQKVREERGLVYTIYSGVSSYSDQGYHSIYLATRPQSVGEALKVIGAEILSLCHEEVPERELAESKENLKGSLMLNLESTYSRMANLARNEMAFGRQFSLEEILSGIDAVQTADLLRLANKTLKGGDLTLAAVGPASGLPSDFSDLGLS